MTRFLWIVIGVYTVPHLAFFARLYPVLIPPLRLPVLLSLLSLMSTLFVGFTLRRHESAFARPLVELSFIWMAFIFWAFSIGLVMDVWNLAIRLIPAAVRPAALSTPSQLRLMAGLILLLFAWSTVEARRVRVRHLAIPGLSAPREIRIAMLSDLHLNPYANHTAVKRALALIRELKPDILLSAGDLIDAPPTQITAALDELASIRPPLGKFAILGNHEYYTGQSVSIEAHRAAGFTVLRETRASPLPGLVIAGVDDIQGRSFGGRCLDDEGKALPLEKNGDIVILLKHRPLLSQTTRDRATLQLSGHTHGGQLFPFHLLVRSHFPHYSGLRHDNDLWLYVSRGTGTWGPRLRLFAPPELTLLTIPAAL